MNLIQCALPPVLQLRTLSLALLGSVFLGCDQAAAPGGVPVAQGCWSLALGAWSGPHDAPDPPLAFALFDTLGTQGLESGRTIARPLPGYPLFFDWAWWERRGADSLTVFFTDGFVAIELRLRGAGTRWQGEAVAIHDVAPPEEARAAATVTPSSCP